MNCAHPAAWAKANRSATSWFGIDTSEGRSNFPAWTQQHRAGSSQLVYAGMSMYESYHSISSGQQISPPAVSKALQPPFPAWPTKGDGMSSPPASEGRKCPGSKNRTAHSPWKRQQSRTIELSVYSCGASNERK